MEWANQGVVCGTSSATWAYGTASCHFVLGTSPGPEEVWNRNNPGVEWPERAKVDDLLWMAAIGGCL